MLSLSHCCSLDGNACCVLPFRQHARVCLASTSAEPRGDPRGQVPATPLLPKALLAGQSVFPTSFYHCHPLSISTREPAALETCGRAQTCCCEAPRSADGTGAVCAGSPTGLGLRPPPKEADKSPARQTFLGGCATAQNGSSTPFEDASRMGALYLSWRGFGFVFSSFFFFNFFSFSQCQPGKADCWLWRFPVLLC